MVSSGVGAVRGTPSPLVHSWKLGAETKTSPACISWVRALWGRYPGTRRHDRLVPASKANVPGQSWLSDARGCPGKATPVSAGESSRACLGSAASARGARRPMPGRRRYRAAAASRGCGCGRGRRRPRRPKPPGDLPKPGTPPNLMGGAAAQRRRPARPVLAAAQASSP